MSLGLHSFASVLYLFGGNAGVDSRLKFLIRGNNSTCGYDGPVGDDGVVHDYGTHADDDIVAYDAAMHIRTMPYGHVITYDALRNIIGGMQHRIVLHIHPVAQPDGSDVSTKHCAVPYAAVAAHAYRAYKCRSLSKKRALSYDGPVALEFLYYCHEAKIQKTVAVPTVEVDICHGVFIKSCPDVSGRVLQALRSHLREEEHILDGRGVGHEHGQTVDTHTKS